MSSRKRTRKRIKTGGGSYKRNKTAYTVVYKLIDPVLQGFLFVTFVYSLDSEFRDFSYRMVFLLIIALQIISLIVNFLLNPPENLNKERLLYAAILIASLIGSVFIIQNFQENYMEVRQGDFPKLPIREIILDTVVIVISFWYNIICFRELKAILKSYNEEDEG